jgi:poly(A) polymerase
MLVDRHAIEVVEKLHEAGFSAYLVGGCVRDLLLDHQPKDFDVATSATPEEVKPLFRRSRLIGRRFRIVHVRFGRELIEVSTFRSNTSTKVDDDRSHSNEGMILRDNVYGTLEEDAFRRDFTINALYYDPSSETVIDYVGGLEDLKRRRLRFIGDTGTRLREDPVRALRAIRFQAKIGFKPDPEITRLLTEAAEAMASIPPARLFDEMVKLLLSGYGERAWQLLADSPLRGVLFPSTAPDDPLMAQAMQNTDERIAQDKPVTPGFMLAVLLWEDYRARAKDHEANAKPAEARFLAAAEALSAQQQVMAIPKRFSQFVRDVWMLQERLLERRPRNIERLFEHQRFRAGYDFLLLRGQVGEEAVIEAADWWTRYQEVNAAQRAEMTGSLSERKPRRRRKKKKSDPQAPDSLECP